MATSPIESFNRNDKQVFFNQIKGVLSEMIDHEKFCNITLDVGHEGVRQVNFVVKKSMFDSIKEIYSIKDKVAVHFYVSSKFKAGRWYTCANLLEIHKSN